MESIPIAKGSIASSLTPIHVIGSPKSPAEVFLAIEKQDDADEVSHLLDASQFDLETPNEIGNTILHHAISCDRPHVARMLAERAWESASGVYRLRNHEGDTPLIQAVLTGNVALIKTLLDVTPRTLDGLSFHGLEASEKSYVYQVARLMIEADGDLGKAFSGAVEHKWTRAAKLFLKAGASTIPVLADLNADLHWCWSKDLIRVSDVLAMLRDPVWQTAEHEDVRKDLMTRHAVHYVLRKELLQPGKQALDAVKCFADGGVLPATLEKGLGKAIKSSARQLQIVDSSTGETLLHWAAVNGVSLKTWKTLVKHYDESLLNSSDVLGYTPLMHIAARGDVLGMQCLVLRGGRTDGELCFSDIRPGFQYAQKDAISVKALMMIEAQGDVSRALEFAIHLRQAEAAKLYFDAGARIDWPKIVGLGNALGWLLREGLIETIDHEVLLSALERAIEDNNEEVKGILTLPHVVVNVLEIHRDQSELAALRALAVVNFLEVDQELLSGAIPHLLKPASIDEKTGDNALHGLIRRSSGRCTAGVVELIWQHAPIMLNVSNAAGKTPLDLAMDDCSSHWIRSLLSVGMRPSNEVNFSDIPVVESDDDMSLSERATYLAAVLIEARGDINQAVEFAFARGHRNAIHELFDLGANAQSILGRADRGSLDRLWRFNALRSDDVLAVLRRAKESGNETLASLLVKPELIMGSLPNIHADVNKVEDVLKRYIALGANGADLLSWEVDFWLEEGGRSSGAELQYAGALVRLGMPTVPAVIKVATRRPFYALSARCMESFLEAFAQGTDLVAAVRHLDNLDQRYAGKLREAAFAGIVRSPTCSSEVKLENLRALITAGLSPSYKAISYLAALIVGGYGNVETNDRIRRLALQTWRLSTAKAMCGEAINSEREDLAELPPGDYFQLIREDVVKVALRDLLARDDLSNAEKVGEIRAWMQSKVASAHASSLLCDALEKNHLATAKVLIYAGAPTKGAFLMQGEMLRRGVPGAQARTWQLIEWGGDPAPAMEHLMASINEIKALGNSAQAEREYAALRKLLLVIASSASTAQPAALVRA